MNKEGTNIKFSDIQNILDAVANLNGSIDGSPHGVFWRQTGDYQKDYGLFTTGEVPNVGLPIMDSASPLNSAFFVILTDTSGFQGIPQMPMNGPYVTDANYTAQVAGVSKSGVEIIGAMTSWLSNGFPM